MKIKNLRKVTVTILLILFVVIGFYCSTIVKTVNADTETANETDNRYDTIISYTDVFEEYYCLAQTELNNNNMEMPYTFDEFCDGYYKCGLEIGDYTDYVIQQVSDVGYAVFESDSAIAYSSFKDEDYILKGISNPNLSDFDPSITPQSAFRRKLHYGVFDYSELWEGDILLETSTILNNIGHTAMIYNMRKSGEGDIEGRSTYIQTIEAVQGGVQFGFLDDDRMIEFGVVVLRATYDNNIIDRALMFTYAQLGKPYNFPPKGRYNKEINSTEWYCSELNAAAYFFAGIDLLVETEHNMVWPFSLMTTSKTAFVSVSKCVDVRLLGKENGKWKLQLYNGSTQRMTVEYFNNLVTENDAKKWETLGKSISSVTLNANSSTVVYINSGSAKYAAFAVDGKNITYCDGLDEVTLRMRVRKNIR